MSNLSVKSQEELRFGTNIIDEEEYRGRLTTIMDIASNMVKKTLGPYGASTIVDDGLSTYATKDGWTVLKNLRFSDAVANALYGSLKQVSFNMLDSVGDGTSTGFVGGKIFLDILRNVMSYTNFRQKDFLDALNEAAADVQTEIENSGKYVHHIDPNGDFEDIYKIAYISSNGNAELAEVIQKIYQETTNPNIFVKFDSGKKLTYEIQRGYKLKCKPIQQTAYQNSDDRTFTLKEPSMVAIFDHNLTYVDHSKIIEMLSRYATVHNCTLFILAPDFDSTITSVIGTSINNMLAQNRIPNIMLIQVPLSKAIDRAYLSDVVFLTNAQTFDPGKVHAFNTMVHNQTATGDDRMSDPLLEMEEYASMNPESFLDMMIGRALDVSVGAKYFMISHFDEIVNPTVYQNKLNEIRDIYLEQKKKAEKSSTNLMKDFMDAYEHYTKFSGNMGTILVGGESVLARNYTKDSVDDSVLACRSAYDYGYIRGLNLATIDAIRSLMDDGDLEKGAVYLIGEGHMYSAALVMFYDTFVELSRTVLMNKCSDDITYQCEDASRPGEVDIMSNEEVLKYAIKNQVGFDMETNTFYPDDECPVINSTKTDIEVIRGMVSIVSMLLTSNQLLSINQVFDRNKTREQKDQEELDRIERIVTTVTKAVVAQINESTSDGKFGLFDSIMNYLKGRLFGHPKVPMPQSGTDAPVCQRRPRYSGTVCHSDPKSKQ